jgi:HTH-type transcriptional regulator / antitoxin HigA
MATTIKPIDHVIRSEAEYDAAVAEIDELLDAEPTRGTPEYERLELLSVLVEAYDDEHYRMGEATRPQDVLDFLLEQRGLTRADLTPILGTRSRVSEFFAGKRGLSLGQIRRLRREFKVPADLLIPTERARRRRQVH